MQRNILTELKERRSVREFTSDAVSEIDLMTVIEAGSWAPSAGNSQPWRFVIIRDKGIISLLSELTVYSTIVAESQALIAIFLEYDLEFDEVQAQQSVGAVMQNMLLTADSIGLGAVWLGEIRENGKSVNRELAIPEQYELAAMMAIGYPAHRNQKSHRKNVNDFILKQIGG
ncbi:nitroreductase family protein [Desulfosediminicola flagellatus]|uniref:nitroreductase family protein n=1 Tax=Desulfosediminicola flagellatus TaxID=2569541 RepID=UPI0010ADA26C|nr:nitroreductase [Desulfosediminicola flagellatus]